MKNLKIKNDRPGNYTLKFPYLLSILLVTTLLFSGCATGTDEEGFRETEGGLQYKFIAEGNGSEPQEDEIMLMHMSYGTSDSLLFDTKEQGAPVPVQFNDSAMQNPGGIEEGFKMLQEGDSCIFKVNADNLFEKTFETQIPPGIDPDNKITFTIGLERIMSMEDYRAFQREQLQSQRSGQITKDSTIISDHLEENNIDAQSTDSGLRYVIRERGSGAPAEPGDSVVVHYTGSLLNGEKFDSSRDRGEPFSFVLGQGRVIEGWDEGIALMREGGKATFYIPSVLAYGERDMGTIEPNSNLMFEVELLEVKK